MSYKNDFEKAIFYKKYIDLENYSLNQLQCFINNCNRAEAEENKRVYCKAIRATLIALGYSEDFVNGKFYDILEDFYIEV